MFKLRILFCLSKAYTTEPHSIRWHFLHMQLFLPIYFDHVDVADQYFLEHQMHISL